MTKWALRNASWFKCQSSNSPYQQNIKRKKSKVQLSQQAQKEYQKLTHNKSSQSSQKFRKQLPPVPSPRPHLINPTSPPAQNKPGSIILTKHYGILYQKREIWRRPNYGAKYEGRHKTTGQVVARKTVRLESKEAGLLNTAVQETSLLKELCHPITISFQDVLMQNSRLHFILKFLGSQQTFAFYCS